jgi:hypothetical protein
LANSSTVATEEGIKRLEQLARFLEVAGFHAWLRCGRHVRKGEKGITILAPLLCKRKANADSQEPNDTVPSLPATLSDSGPCTFSIDYREIFENPAWPC